MNEVVMYRHGSFIDYQGKEHKIIVCALSRKINKVDGGIAMEGAIYQDCNDYDGNIYVPSKMLTFGVAICNPTDTYDEKHGEMIAYNKAKGSNAPIITSNRLGFFNTYTVTAMLQNYLDYIEKDPDSVIPGYNQAKKKFSETQKLKEEASRIINNGDKEKIKALSTVSVEELEYAKKIAKYLD